ncbi:YczE/YyaS/YitT family protein [Bacillus sp. EB01]|uniref:YczE/YyaS/YitT family protein n=1 Tax=Bacillus sp. EB01 TaxID=1347086 RepID=UPI0005C6BF66|nr:YitT family protein [Bacillus sp. EB01]
MFKKRKGQIGARLTVFTIGLLIMSLGVVLLIRSNAGATPWDVFHVGLYYQIGLTVGSWSILVGVVILTAAAIIAKEIPHIGAFLNMLLIGVFIDMYMLMPFIKEPSSHFGEAAMFALGIIVYACGMGVYISAGLGTGPRDSLMAAVYEKTGWKIRNVRGSMEVIVLLIGWWLGGPVSWGTILFSFMIGPIFGAVMPQCNRLTDVILEKVKRKDELHISKEA